MKLWSSVAVAYAALAAHRLRSALTMLGIILGVASVIAMVAIGAGTQTRIQEELQALGANVMVLVSGAANSQGARLGVGTRPTITEADAKAIRLEIAAVAAVSPAIGGNAQIIAGNANWTTGVSGVTEEYFIVRDWYASAGRVLETEEVAAGRKSLVLGQTVADKLFPDQDPIGQVVRINKVPFTVVGVLQRKGQNLSGVDQDDTVMMPLSAAANRVVGRNPANPRSVGGIGIKIQDGANMAATAEEIRKLIRQRHGISPGREDDFWLRNLSEIIQAKEETSRIMSLLLAAVASVSLIVGGIGIMNIMLVSVTERTREIGIRMAVGARRRDILIQFLIEAIVLSMIGGAIGLILGVGGSLTIDALANLRVELNLQGAISALLFAAAVGVFFGFYPAKQAASLPPMDALRYE